MIAWPAGLLAGAAVLAGWVAWAWIRSRVTRWRCLNCRRPFAAPLSALLLLRGRGDTLRCPHCDHRSRATAEPPLLLAGYEWLPISLLLGAAAVLLATTFRDSL